MQAQLAGPAAKIGGTARVQIAQQVGAGIAEHGHSQQRGAGIKAAAAKPRSGDRAVPAAGEHLKARSHVQEPQDAELALPVVDDRVGARTRVRLRVPQRRLALQDLRQGSVLPDVGELAEMPVSHDLHTLLKVSPAKSKYREPAHCHGGARPLTPASECRLYAEACPDSRFPASI